MNEVHYTGPCNEKGNKTAQGVLAIVNGIFKVRFQGPKNRLLGKQK